MESDKGSFESLREPKSQGYEKQDHSSQIMLEIPE